jgi:two-component sensor histidine kinase
MRLLFLVCIFFWAQVGQCVPVEITGGNFAPIKLDNYAKVYEDKANSGFSVKQIIEADSLFSPLENHPKSNPKSTYWVKVSINNSDIKHTNVVFSLRTITYVEAWLYDGNKIVVHKKAGVFRPASELAEGDGRTFMNFDLAPQKSYTLFLKVNEVKGFMPGLNFELFNSNQYGKKVLFQRGIDSALMGAIGILFIYIFISWVLSRFRLYLWLMIFSFGVFMYTFCLRGYLIDWIIPEHPIIGWTFTPHFVLLGLTGACILLDGFLGLDTMNLKFYKLFKVLPLVLTLTSMVMIIMVVGFQDYPFAMNASTIVTALIYPFGAYYMFKSWPRLSRDKKVFVIGVVSALILGFSQNLRFMFTAEKAIVDASLVTGTGLLCVMLFFMLSIKEGMRRRQKTKYNTLAEHSLAQEQYNMELEEKVQIRTMELDKRNKRIQNLMHELQHRVKNNLQLLYGLNRMKEPKLTDKAIDVWKKNLVQIKAISLANNQLEDPSLGNKISLEDYFKQVIKHIRQIYDPRGTIDLLFNEQDSGKIKVSNAISIGLILTEILANSYQHAFDGTEAEQLIVIKILKRENGIELVCYDTGKGVNEHLFKTKDYGGFGMIKDLGRQLNGTVKLKHNVKDVTVMVANDPTANQAYPSTLFSFIFPPSL